MLENVSFTYPKVATPIIEDMSLRVERGESLAVMGASGSGKTTLLALAGLLIAPQAGTVYIDDTPRHVADAPSVLGRTVAWILQTVSLLPHRSVLDNVLLPAVIAGDSRGDHLGRAEELLDVLGIEQRTQRARTLSGGESQRVGIARALLLSPTVLIADEPTASLDAHTAELVMSALLRACTGTALLIATHDRDVAAAADRVLDLQAVRSR